MEHPELVMKFLTVLGAPLKNGASSPIPQIDISWVLCRLIVHQPLIPCPFFHWPFLFS